MAKRAILRVARKYHMRQLTEDVLSDARLAMFQRWLAPDPIRNPAAYAAQIARSVVRHLRRGYPRSAEAIDELPASDMPAMPSFDELVARQPVEIPTMRGRTQKLILQAVCAGSSLESLSGGMPSRLAALRFHAKTMASKIRRSRKGMRESESPNSM